MTGGVVHWWHALSHGEGVNDMMELSISELGAQRVELLPARETLNSFNLADVWATNTSTALNIATEDSVAMSEAWQNIVVFQQ